MRSLHNCRAGLPPFLQARRVIHSHECTVELVKQKTCSLREQRTRASSILTFSWRILDEPPRWKFVAEPRKMSGFLASVGEEFNLGPETRLDHSELLCNKVLLKYKGDRDRNKGDRESFRRWQKEYPLASVSRGVIYFLITYYSESKDCLEVVKTSLDPLP